MKTFTRTTGTLFILTTFVLCAMVYPTWADVSQTFVTTGGTRGILVEPEAPIVKKNVGLAAFHSDSNYFVHSSCTELAERGYTVFCGNHDFTNNDLGNEGWWQVAPDISNAVAYLRGLGLGKVLLKGHSMGAPLMLFYQNLAENGPAAACDNDAVLLRCPTEGILLGDLEPADGIIIRDPHIGRPFATLSNIDPAIANENKPQKRKRKLDMFDAKNGFDDASRTATYNQEFLDRFLAGQGKRSNKLIKHALKRLEKIQAGKGDWADDEPFPVPGSNVARIWRPDLNLLRETRNAHTVVKTSMEAAGYTTEVQDPVVSVRVPSTGSRKEQTKNFSQSALNLTVRSWLGIRAVTTTDDYAIAPNNITGVVWESSHSSAPQHAAAVTVPLLIFPHTGHYFLVTAEIIYDYATGAGHPDVTYAALEGADHGGNACGPCEAAQGVDYGDTRKAQYNYIRDWIDARF